MPTSTFEERVRLRKERVERRTQDLRQARSSRPGRGFFQNARKSSAHNTVMYVPYRPLILPQATQVVAATVPTPPSDTRPQTRNSMHFAPESPDVLAGHSRLSPPDANAPAPVPEAPEPPPDPGHDDVLLSPGLSPIRGNSPENWDSPAREVDHVYSQTTSGDRTSAPSTAAPLTPGPPLPSPATPIHAATASTAQAAPPTAGSVVSRGRPRRSSNFPVPPPPPPALEYSTPRVSPRRTFGAGARRMSTVAKVLAVQTPSTTPGSVSAVHGTRSSLETNSFSASVILPGRPTMAYTGVSSPRPNADMEASPDVGAPLPDALAVAEVPSESPPRPLVSPPATPPPPQPVALPDIPEGSPPAAASPESPQAGDAMEMDTEDDAIPLRQSTSQPKKSSPGPPPATAPLQPFQPVLVFHGPMSTNPARRLFPAPNSPDVHGSSSSEASTPTQEPSPQLPHVVVQPPPPPPPKRKAATAVPTPPSVPPQPASPDVQVSPTVIPSQPEPPSPPDTPAVAATPVDAVPPAGVVPPEHPVEPVPIPSPVRRQPPSPAPKRAKAAAAPLPSLDFLTDPSAARKRKRPGQRVQRFRASKRQAQLHIAKMLAEEDRRRQAASKGAVPRGRMPPNSDDESEECQRLAEEWKANPGLSKLVDLKVRWDPDWCPEMTSDSETTSNDDDDSDSSSASNPEEVDDADEIVTIGASHRCEDVPLNARWKAHGQRCVPGRSWLVIHSDSEEERIDRLEEQAVLEEEGRMMQLDDVAPEDIRLTGAPSGSHWLTQGSKPLVLKAVQAKVKGPRQRAAPHKRVSDATRSVVIPDLALPNPDGDGSQAAEVGKLHLLGRSGAISYYFVDVTRQLSLDNERTGAEEELLLVISGQVGCSMNSTVYSARAKECIRVPPQTTFTLQGQPRARIQFCRIAPDHPP